MKYASTCHRPFALTTLAATLALSACGGGQPAADAETEPAAQSAGDEQPEQAQDSASTEQAEQEASERAMERVVELSMQLGSQRAALAKQLDKPQPDCERSEVLRDRICETAANICTISEEQQEAAGHCDRSNGKCERAKRDVEDLRCRRGRRG